MTAHSLQSPRSVRSVRLYFVFFSTPRRRFLTYPPGKMFRVKTNVERTASGRDASFDKANNRDRFVVQQTVENR
jgi:hypothetical protein